MHPVAEAVFVGLPILGAAWFVAWFAWRCFREGQTLVEILFDRRFLMVVFYTGSLLAIYLSSVHFFSLGIP